MYRTLARVGKGLMADEKRRIPVWIIVAALVVAALVGYGVFYYTRTDQVRVDLPAIGGPFSLIDQNGKTVTEDRKSVV